MIIALAGRRIDAADAKEARFSAANVGMVRDRVRAMLKRKEAKALVCSAACGADLIALAEARGMGLKRRVVLPFEPSKFRDTSVTDRPGEWGPRFDQEVEDVVKTEDLVVLQTGSEQEAYAAANTAILNEALRLGKELHVPVTAVLVWEGKSRGEGDLTEGFGKEARDRGIPVEEVLTI